MCIWLFHETPRVQSYARTAWKARKKLSRARGLGSIAQQKINFEQHLNFEPGLARSWASADWQTHGETSRKTRPSITINEESLEEVSLKRNNAPIRRISEFSFYSSRQVVVALRAAVQKIIQKQFFTLPGRQRRNTALTHMNSILH